MEQVYNPYLPLTTYIPDGEPHLYPYTYTVSLQGDTYIAEYRDGAMYLPFPYGSATLERMTKYN